MQLIITLLYHGYFCLFFKLTSIKNLVATKYSVCFMEGQSQCLLEQIPSGQYRSYIYWSEWQNYQSNKDQELPTFHIENHYLKSLKVNRHSTQSSTQSRKTVWRQRQCHHIFSLSCQQTRSSWATICWKPSIQHWRWINLF